MSDPSTAFSKRKRRKSNIKFEVGNRIEARDDWNKWYTAKILEVDDSKRRILIHFERWSARFDEWLDSDSDRIRPIPRSSQRRDAQKKPARYKVGSEVLAKWKNGKKYPAKVTATAGGCSYKVAFYDGISTVVNASNISPLVHDEVPRSTSKETDSHKGEKRRVSDMELSPPRPQVKRPRLSLFDKKRHSANNADARVNSSDAKECEVKCLVETVEESSQTDHDGHQPTMSGRKELEKNVEKKAKQAAVKEEKEMPDKKEIKQGSASKSVAEGKGEVKHPTEGNDKEQNSFATSDNNLAETTKVSSVEAKHSDSLEDSTSLSMDVVVKIEANDTEAAAPAESSQKLTAESNGMHQAAAPTKVGHGNHVPLHGTSTEKLELNSPAKVAPVASDGSKAPSHRPVTRKSDSDLVVMAQRETASSAAARIRRPSNQLTSQGVRTRHLSLQTPIQGTRKRHPSARVLAAQSSLTQHSGAQRDRKKSASHLSHAPKDRTRNQPAEAGRGYQLEYIPWNTPAPKELIIEEDHNQYKCKVKDCNKSFRKESLLAYHVKYYHPDRARRIVSPQKKKKKQLSSKSATQKKDFPAPEVTTTNKQQALVQANKDKKNVDDDDDDVATSVQRKKTVSICSTDSDISVGVEKSPPVSPSHKSRKKWRLTARKHSLKQTSVHLHEDPVESQLAKTKKINEKHVSVKQELITVPKIVVNAAKSSEESASAAAAEASSSVSKFYSKKSAVINFELAKSPGGDGALSNVVADHGRSVSKHGRLYHNPAIAAKKSETKKKHEKRKNVSDDINSTPGKNVELKSLDAQMTESVSVIPDDKNLVNNVVVSVEEKTTPECDSSSDTVIFGLDELSQDMLESTENDDEKFELAKNGTISCVCNSVNENGLMIQCEKCFCWQHAECVGCTDDSIPSTYTCPMCRSPKGLRIRGKYRHDQTWFETGKLPAFNFIPESDTVESRAKRSLVIHNLSSDLTQVRTVISHLWRKIKLATSEDNPDLTLFKKPWVRDGQLPPTLGSADSLCVNANGAGGDPYGHYDHCYTGRMPRISSVSQIGASCVPQQDTVDFLALPKEKPDSLVLNHHNDNICASSEIQSRQTDMFIPASVNASHVSFSGVLPGNSAVTSDCASSDHPNGDSVQHERELPQSKHFDLSENGLEENDCSKEFDKVQQLETVDDTKPLDKPIASELHLSDERHISEFEDITQPVTSNESTPSAGTCKDPHSSTNNTSTTIASSDVQITDVGSPIKPIAAGDDNVHSTTGPNLQSACDVMPFGTHASSEGELNENRMSEDNRVGDWADVNANENTEQSCSNTKEEVKSGEKETQPYQSIMNLLDHVSEEQNEVSSRLDFIEHQISVLESSEEDGYGEEKPGGPSTSPYLKQSLRKLLADLDMVKRLSLFRS